MNATTKARAMKALIEAAEGIASELAAQLLAECDTRGAPAEINQMVGAAMHAETLAQQVLETCQAIKNLQRVAVAS